MNDIRTVIKTYYPALILESYIPRKFRRIVKFLSLASIAICIALFVIVEVHTPIIGILSISIAVWLKFFMLDAFFASYYFEGLQLHHKEGMQHASIRASYEAALILYEGEYDVVLGLLQTNIGKELLIRSGVQEDAFEAFARARTQRVPAEKILHDGYITLEDIAGSVYSQDEEFKSFLFKHDVQEEEFIASARWIDTLCVERKKEERSWGRDKLGRIPALGKDWSYGRAYTLEKYSKYIEELPLYPSESRNEEEIEREVKLIESVLSRSSEANALVISESLETAMDIIARTAFHIEHRTIFPELEHLKMIVFDPGLLFSSNGEKPAIEQELIRVCNEAVKAGNLVIVIPDIASVIASAQAFNVDFLSILDSYLAHSAFKVIATVIPESFYSKLEHNSLLLERFETVKVEKNDPDILVHELGHIVPLYERKYKVIFTYPALRSIAQSAAYYFSSGILSDKVEDLMEELIPFARAKNISVITDSNVSDLVEIKTGIPTGKIQDEEKELLLQMEDRLHAWVIGQDEAIKGISNSLRRARSGIRSGLRPMGTFLFLGPTGVGKTETAKALASVFFGSVDAMIRFDMSEYQGHDALDKLIGSFTSGSIGTLSTRLREKPYGVVLLDEFEKTTDQVKDLFLQIFDEGAFSDMSGKKIYARDCIFIATSNAGSDMIWEYFNAGEDPSLHDKELIDSVISAHFFKPELLNRFDNIVVFHPLDYDQLRTIARLMLERLRKRLYEQSINVVITPELVEYVAHAGYDPKFGARPMNRVIQDKVEQYISRGLLEGTITKGDTVTIPISALESL